MARTLISPTIAQTTTVGDIITAGSGVTISAATFTTFGNVASLAVTFSYSSAIPDGTQITVGTLKSGKRPTGGADIGSARFVGAIATGGQVYARNAQGSQLAADTSVSIYSTFILP